MKKDGHALLVILFCSLCLVIGIFIGRNLDSEYVALKVNTQPTVENSGHDFTAYRLDINTATKKQLQELPGIGEVIAQRIIDYRTQNGGFESIDELQNVEGIGEKKLRAIMDLIRVGG